MMNTESDPTKRVIVAGVGGASLGTETLKALALSGNYKAIAADVSALAYGFYQKEATSSHLLRASHYIEDLIACCQREKAQLVLPSAEPTLKLISAARELLHDAGITPVLNKLDVLIG